MDVFAPNRSVSHQAKRTLLRKQIAKLFSVGLVASSAAVFVGAIASNANAAQPLTDPIVASAGQAPVDSSQAAADTSSEAAGEPYVVFVADQKAYTRCGPGEKHYRTDELRVGQELEVYVETEDGWLGIRPTEDSFCWVSGDSVRLDSNGEVATVLEDKTIAWIGTNLGQARRYRWQVQLQSGEEVAVIDVATRQDGAAEKKWMRIVPPSGEFRWVHRDQVVDSAEALAAVIAKNAASAKLASAKTQAKPANSVGKTLQPVRPIAAAKPQEVKASPAVQRVASESVAESSTTQRVAEADVNASKSAEPRSADPGLRVVNNVPQLQPIRQTPRAVVQDRAIQFHRGVDVEEFEDRGAVIGSGLRRDWGSEDAALADAAGDSFDRLAGDLDASSVLSEDAISAPPANGAAAAASAIASPFKKVSEVVANFISPPRIVQIDTRDQNAMAAQASFDQQWSVGPGRQSPVQPNLMPPQSLGAIASYNTSPIATAAPVGGNALSQIGSRLGEPQVSPANHVAQASRVAQASAAETAKRREVSVEQIARIADAMVTADVGNVDRWLSKLIAESASADEMDPLIRRAEDLLRTGVIADANRTRELLSRAREYRYIAARRDGPTLVRGNGVGVRSEPVLTASQSHAPASQSITTASQAVAPASATVEMPLQTQVPAKVVPVEDPKPVRENATGYLVQVYSSRPNSPPYALTDETGVTTAYVTPFPGINLRTHLNSRVAVKGQQKLLEGMSTPHFLVDEVIRR
ncbi:hypothetical protein LOC67_19410 [Stieleria sp. JC731]|uniref:hypothetical protein n=1 Tax=Pirellulaceae TaxID=2691357 RepID=UPI001E310DF0|nr:hypothetical protein [Stieleria sp. JC731]MCC9602723.1 hypothetical protein [Stieleria sp. JC731]